MKKSLLVLILLIFAQQLYAKEWYQGGSLHGSNLSQWSAASNNNKLATASDWIVIVLGDNEVQNMALLKQKSSILVNCIDTLIPTISKSYKPEDTEIRATGLLCITQLHSNGWR